MADYGVTSTGFKNKPLSVIIEEMEANFQATFGNDINISIESPEGQIIDMVGNVAKALWNVGEQSYNAFSPSGSSEITLENVVQLNNITRGEAQPSTVTVKFTGDDGIVIPAGTTVSTSAILTGSDSISFDTESDATISGTEVETLVIAQVAGAVDVAIGTVVVIDTPVVGITEVTNDVVGNIGKDEESDPELRARREILVALPAVSTTDAIAAGIQEIETVNSVVVLENPESTDSTVEGVLLEPHSVKVIVQGAETIEENTLIGTAIYDRKDPGIPTYGLQSEVIVDTQGFNHTMRWDTPTLIPIYITINTDAEGTSFPSDGSNIVDSILEYMADPTTGAVIGKDVSYARMFVPVNNIPDHYVQSMYIGTTASPTGTSDIEIAGSELASFTEVNITVYVNYPS